MTGEKVWEQMLKQHRWFERRGRKPCHGAYGSNFRGEKCNGNTAPSVGWGCIPVGCAVDWSQFCELLNHDQKLGEVLRIFPNRHTAREWCRSVPTQKVILRKVKSVSLRL